MKFNEIDLKHWHECGINVDSLWLIASRDKSGKHRNIYHGNFVPQIARELITRYTKRHEVVLDAFLGSGTTLYECENLGRKCIGMDINEQILNYIKQQMDSIKSPEQYYFGLCDNTNTEKVRIFMRNALDSTQSKSVQFALFHPPYMDIIKFTDKKEDLSQIGDIKNFLDTFLMSLNNTLQFLDKNRYFAIVIGDVYKKSEVVPLGFYIMNLIKQNFAVKLKGIIVKNIEGNRGKLGSQNIWQYRAISSDYYLFKHEYIFVFKKEF